MNVLLLSGHPLSTGGVETYLLTLLKNARDDVRFVLAAPREGSFLSRAQAGGASVTTWEPSFPGGGAAGRWLEEFASARKIEIVHCQDLRSHLVVIQSGLASRGVRTVRTFHMPSSSALPRRSLRDLARRFYYFALETFANATRTDRLIVVTAGLLGHPSLLLPRWRGRLECIENGVDLTRFQPGLRRQATRRSMGVAEEAVVFCTVGRLEAQKDQRLLIEAAAELPRQVAWELWVVGEGSLLKDLQHAAEGAGGRVRLLETEVAVPDALGAADVFCLTSRFEGRPMALLEAMASGLPCLVTESAGGGLIRASGAGIVARATIGEVARAMRLFLHDPDLRLGAGRKARQASVEFDASRMVEATLAVYRALAASPGADR